MIELVKGKENCCGCSACFNVCPQKAITMIPDGEGFKYPVINAENCVECGLCKSVCAFQDDKLEFNHNLKTYAVKHKEDAVRLSSSSGGVFTAISDLFINDGGVVYGVRFNEAIVAVHSRATTFEQREKFKGSKYVQSDLGDIFQQVKADLNEGKSVLFTGTPCQCAGLKYFLITMKTDISNLILCDMVCHGTPSPLIFAEHIKYLEKKSKSKVKDYACRCKINGWHSHTERCIYENGVVDYQTPYSQAHKKIFYSHNTLRPSCHNCKYTSVKRVSDITIADYWGIEKVLPDFADKKGVSLVLINTYKGENVFKELRQNVMSVETSIEDCLQPQLLRPSEPSLHRDEFWEDYSKKGYLYIVKKYATPPLKYRLKAKVKRILVDTNLLVFAKKILRR